jgi:hypothetical protein
MENPSESTTEILINPIVGEQTEKEIINIPSFDIIYQSSISFYNNLLIAVQ